MTAGYALIPRFLPSVPTLVMRIYDSYPGSHNTADVELRESNLLTVCEYTFDDQDVDTLVQHYPETDLTSLAERHVLFTPDIAKTIIDDFREHYLLDGDVLVHCTLCVSRSPAVVMGLNDVFNLGWSTDKMMKKKASYNKMVYRMIRKVGGKY